MSKFGGDDGHGPEDEPRLTTQLYRVYEIMFDAKWRTIPEIVGMIQAKYDMRVETQSASARLRDFRKTKFGGHTLLKNNLGRGLWEYQLIVKKSDD